jgi:uncharacterized sulfatase
MKKSKRKNVVRNFNRRDFLKAATIGAAAGIGYRQVHKFRGRDYQPDRADAYLASIQPHPNPAQLPNIVIILVDDLGFGDLGAPSLETPNLQRMADEGLQMTSFYAAASVCSPSRAALLTGRYPVRTLITNPLLSTHDAMNIVMNVLGRYSYNVRGIPEDEVLLSEVLSRRGYRTALVGKWHLGDRPSHLPNDRGFDFFYGAWWSNDDQPYALYRNREVEVPSPADQNVLTQNFTREAISFLHASQDQPFFLYLAHAMPHVPIHASADFRGKSRGGLYGDAVQELDWSLGQVLSTLDDLGVSENTLVIFSSDNGPWWQGNPGYARGRKLLWFEGGFRVPFLARWPDVIPAGMTTSAMSMNFDLFPTCLGLAGIPLPQDRIIDGADILPLLMGSADSPHETLYFFDTRNLVAVRYHQWKYYRRYITDNAAFWPLHQGPHLFDLALDPTESYSLVESQPELAEEMAGMLGAFKAHLKDNLRGWL